MITRLAIDCAMVSLTATAFAYQLTGNDAHEIFGVSLLLLISFHNTINYRWYRHSLKPGGSLPRLLSGATTLVLIAAFVTMTATGLFNSHLLFPGEPGSANQFLRQIHVVAANWFLLLASVHLGFHWRMPAAALRSTGTDRVHAAVRQLLAAAIVVNGIHAALAFEFPARLIGYYSFAYWDFDAHPCLFFAEYISIVLTIAILAHKATTLFHFLADRRGTAAEA